MINMGNLDIFEKNLKKQREKEERIEENQREYSSKEGKMQEEIEQEVEEEAIQEDMWIIKRIVSRLCFIRSDLQEIEKLDIKTKDIRQIIRGMRSRTELLLNMFFPKINGK